MILIIKTTFELWNKIKLYFDNPDESIFIHCLSQAWDTRDQAVARKNNCEIELAKTRIDLMQVNSQLLEAITQKVELSQQLDQWQVNLNVIRVYRKQRQSY